MRKEGCGLRYMKGYVALLMTGKEPERFLNLCAANRIDLWDLIHTEDGYRMKVSVRDYFRLGPLCRKTHSRVRILEKRGLPFLLQRCLKRKAFFLGFAIAAVLLYILSLFIWNIHVEGNYANSTWSVLEYLEESGVSHGILKSRVDCTAIAEGIREEFPNVTWVSARIQGTRLILEIRENTDSYREEKTPSGDSWDLVATADGVVASIFTRSGVPCVRAGDICQAGDILVSGAVPVNNDNGETVRYEYVQADADIVVETERYYYDEFSMTHMVRTYSGETEVHPFLQIFQWRFTLGGAEQESCDYLVKEQKVRLTENFILPFSYGTVETLPYTESREQYSEEEAERLAGERLGLFCDRLEKTGVEISKNNVTIDLTESSCISRGSLTVREAAYKQAPCALEEEIPSGKEESEE